MKKFKLFLLMAAIFVGNAITIMPMEENAWPRIIENAGKSKFLQSIQNAIKAKILESQEFGNVKRIFVSFKDKIISWINPNNALAREEQPFDNEITIKLIEKVRSLNERTPLVFENGEWLTVKESKESLNKSSIKLTVIPENLDKPEWSQIEKDIAPFKEAGVVPQFDVDILFDRFNPTAKIIEITPKDKEIIKNTDPKVTNSFLGNLGNLVKHKPFESIFFLGFSTVCAGIVYFYYDLYKRYKNEQDPLKKKDVINKATEPILPVLCSFVLFVVSGRSLYDTVKEDPSSLKLCRTGGNYEIEI